MIFPACHDSIVAAADLLKKGGVVAFPTETVYGLGADASNPQAIKRIFRIKGRPENHPLIVHVADLSALNDWAVSIPAMAYHLAERFWPGPLTLILHKAPHVPFEVTGGQETIGVRMPNHPVAIELIRAFGGGLAAPSANLFGRLSPTRAQHVEDQLGGLIDMVIDGGPCGVGLESTIVNLTGESPQILRPGGVSLAALSEALQQDIDLETRMDDPRVSGSLKSHYSPLTPLKLRSFSELAELIAAGKSTGGNNGFLIHSEELINKATAKNLVFRSISVNYAIYSKSLYDMLHSLDKLSLDAIFIEAPPVNSEWLAVADRLQRASAKTDRT